MFEIKHTFKVLIFHKYTFIQNINRWTVDFTSIFISDKLQTNSITINISRINNFIYDCV